MPKIDLDALDATLQSDLDTMVREGVMTEAEADKLRKAIKPGEKKEGK